MTYITDGNRRDRYFYYTGMRFFPKVVTALLLILLGATQVFAATPGQEEMKASTCCKHGCPMTATMAEKAKSDVQPLIGLADSTHCSCKSSPGAPALIFIAPGQRESREMVLVDDTVISFESVVTLWAEENSAPPDRDSRRHSQSVLCTFLI